MSVRSIALAAPPAPDASPKRRQVLDAARDLFLARGYGAASMDAIAQHAGVSKATVYAYFPSKNALFATMMSECSIADMVADHLYGMPQRDLRSTLQAIGDMVLPFLLSEQTLALFRIVVAEGTRFPELGRAFYAEGPQRGKERMRGWLVEQQAAGTVRADADLRTAAEQFAALLRSGLFMRAVMAVPPPPTEAEIAATVAAAVETWLRAYAA